MAMATPMTSVTPEKQKTAEVLLGAHVSAAGGHALAIDRAAAIGANFAQVFSGSPRVWARPKLESIDVKTIHERESALGVRGIITHALYLTNVASDNPELVAKSQTALTFDLSFDAAVGGRGVVVHLGSHQGRGWAAVREQVAKVIAAILETSPENSHLLIENSAGQSGKLCSDLSEIVWLLKTVNSPRLQWCLDTCHAWCAGYALRDLDTQLTELGLWSTLACVHVNDSRDPFDSGRDRHANLGDGTIPKPEFQAWLQNPKLQGIPLILEVPGIDGEGPDSENIARLRTLVTP